MPKNEAKIKFSADVAEFNKSIKQSNDTMNELRAEMRLNETQMKATGTTVEGLENKHRILSAQLEAANDKTVALSSKIETATQYFGENSTEVNKLKIQLLNAQNAEEQLKQAVNNCRLEILAQSTATQQTESATDKLKRTIQENEDALKQTKKEYADLMLEGKATEQATAEYRETVNALSKELEEQKKRLSEAENAFSQLGQEVEETTGDIESASDKLKRTITEQEEELKQLKKEYANLSLEGNATKETTDIYKKSIELLNAELKENKRQLNEAETAFDEVNEEVEESTEHFTTLNGVMANLVADGIKKTVEGLVDITKSAFELSNDIEKATNTFIAKTGESTELAIGFQDVMVDIYNANYGESFEDIADSMAIVKGAFTDINNSQLENITTKALLLRDTFDFDVSESIRTAKGMMNQFGISADEAFELMVQGVQSGLNQNGDLLDVLNEYSVQFKNAGFSAEEMLNMLSNGVQEGTWSVDKLGDALKEFSIRTKDTAQSTIDAFSDLGYGATASEESITKVKDEISKLEKNLKYARMEQANFNEKTSELTKVKNADKIKEYTFELEIARNKLSELSQSTETSRGSIEDLQERLGAGGEIAKQAMQEVVQALASIDDPIKQNELGVALFGTMWEDLGEKAIFSLMNTQGEIDKTQDTLEKINQVKYDDLGSALEGVKRNLQTSVAEPLQNEVLPIVNDFIENTDWQAVGESAGQAFGILARGALEAVNAVRETIQFLNEHKAVVVAVATATGVLTTALTAYNVVQGVKTAMDAAGTTTVWGLVKAHVAQATAALAAIAPYVLVVAAIAAVIAIIVLCIKHWDEIVVVVKYAWEAIKTTLASVGYWIDTTILQPFRDGWDWIVTSTTEAFEKVSEAIWKPIENTKKKIDNFIYAIEYIFRNVKLAFPNIPTPHFSIKPSGWNIGDLLQGSIPSLSIAWYKEGAIFQKPTIFPTATGFKGVGEAGAEAVLPIDKLQGYIQNAIDKTVNNTNIDVLARAVNNLANRPNVIQIGDREIAIATAGASDKVNGARTTLKNRGLAI